MGEVPEVVIWLRVKVGGAREWVFGILGNIWLRGKAGGAWDRVLSGLGNKLAQSDGGWGLGRGFGWMRW